ncbi:hypothetical protein C8Q76DRAFT_790713 [Earliella scabrosa]|nr:hypothetical protein C8Q76DRAFT_790713 [Earliella scabrosa]
MANSTAIQGQLSPGRKQMRGTLCEREREVTSNVLELLENIRSSTLQPSVLQVVAIAGLDEAARILLNILEGIKAMGNNKRHCLPVVSRSVVLLDWLHNSFEMGGDDIVAKLKPHLTTLVQSLQCLYNYIKTQTALSWIQRYVRRNEIAYDLEEYHEDITDVYKRCHGSLQIATLKAPVAAEFPLGPLAAKCEREQNAGAILGVASKAGIVDSVVPEL